MGTVHNISTKHLNTVAKQRRESYGEYISPDYLQDFLQPAQTRIMTFRSRATMESYRRMLYTINKQGDYRYRTIRDEASAWGLIIWRMK